jgi:hypothetical protein
MMDLIDAERIAQALRTNDLSKVTSQNLRRAHVGETTDTFGTPITIPVQRKAINSLRKETLYDRKIPATENSALIARLGYQI